MNSTEFLRLKRLGAEATRLLADDSFREILADLKNRAIRGWAEGKTADAREEFWRDLQAVGRLENYMGELGQQYRAEAQKAEAEERKRNGRRS